MDPDSETAQGAVGPADLRSQWDTQFKRGILVLILIFTIFLLWLARPVLPLIIAAGLLSYVLNPVINFLSRGKAPRGAVTLGCYLLLLAGFAWSAYAMIPVLDQQYQTVLSIASNLLTALWDGIGQLPDSMWFMGAPVELSAVKQALEPWLSGTAADFFPRVQATLARLNAGFPSLSGLFRGTLDFGLGIINTGVSIILSFLFVFVVSLYLTKDAPRIRAFLVSNFPSQYQAEWVSLIQCIGNVWHAFFWGQLILSVTIGLMTYAVLSFLGVQGALIFALIAGALEIIPNLGPVIAAVPPMLVGLATGSTAFPEMNHVVFCLIIALASFVVQQLENVVIVPRLIGRLVKIHPILIITGVTVGYLSNGVMGAFLAAPLLGSARVLGTYVFAKLMNYPVAFPQTKSHLPLREYDVTILIRKGKEAETDADSDSESESAATVKDIGLSAATPADNPVN